MLYLLAASGGLCWVAADWPMLIPRPWNLAILVSWPVLGGVFVLLGALQRRWERRIGSLLRDTEEKPHP